MFQTPAAASAGASFTPVLGRALSTVATTAVSAASECECDDMTEAIMQSPLAFSGEEEMQRQQQIEEEWVVHEAMVCSLEEYNNKPPACLEGVAAPYFTSVSRRPAKTPTSNVTTLPFAVADMEEAHDNEMDSLVKRVLFCSYLESGLDEEVMSMSTWRRWNTKLQHSNGST